MTTPFPKVFNQQVAENAILEYIGGKQHYLGNVFCLPGYSSLASTGETNKFLISNASTNTKAMFIFQRRFTADAQSYAKFYIAPTVSANGSAASVYNQRPASTNTSISACYTAPTTTGNGNLITNISSSNGSVETNALYILDPGQTMLVTVTSLTGSGGTPTDAYLELYWYEI